jgi:uncharacterized protein (DUF1697 family)
MARYAAFLRGVSPVNARMHELRACFEAAGFGQVRTLLSSGNVVFEARAGSAAALQRRIEVVLQERLGQTFLPLVRSAAQLSAVLAADPYQEFRVGPTAKRIVTFLRSAPARPPRLPLAADEARILCIRGTEVFSIYLPNPRGPLFMSLIERTFGKDVTTRTWDTVRKVSGAIGANA